MASTACFLHHHAPSTTTATPSRTLSQRPLATKPTQLTCRAQKQPAANEDETNAVSRRLALTVLIGGAALGARASPADAAYGEAGKLYYLHIYHACMCLFVCWLSGLSGASGVANVFGKPKTNTDFLPYNGNGFKLMIPAKWNPSKEVEYPGQVLRYEDNFDSNSNVTVVVTPTDKKSIKDYGPPEAFISQVSVSLTYNTIR